MLTDSTFMPLEFLRPFWLLGIIAVLLFSLLSYKTAKKNRQQGLIAAHLSEHLVTTPEHPRGQRFAFPLLAILACIALSGPSFRSIDMPIYELEKAQILVLDLSYSMYATDLKPNRLSQEKYKAIDLIKAWSEGEKALITYAGDAFTISPLTTDGNAILNHIPHLSPEIMPVTGSRADLALERAIELLKNSGHSQGHIVFFSDNIDSQTSEKMIKRLKGTPWVVSILAMATEQGAAIKLPDGSLLKNQQDEIVIPKLNKRPLYNISHAANGLYLTADKSNADIERLGRYFSVEDVHKNNSGRSESTRFAKDDGYWLTFLLLPLFLFLFRKGVFYVLLLAAFAPLSSPTAEASIWNNKQQNAFQAYQEKDYETAANLYEDPLKKGSALYKNKQYKEALAEFEQASENDPSNANAFYNQGNAYAQLQQFDESIQAYQHALTLDSKFKAAQENKKLIEDLKKQQQQNSEQQNSEQQNNEQQNNEQQNNEQQNSEQQNSEQQNSEQQNSEQQNSEQQNSEQQNSEQQNSEQQNSEQQNSEQQNSEQQNSEQQNSEQQNSEQQNSEQQNSEQQNSEQQNSEQQNSEQQKQPEDSQQASQAAQAKDAEQSNQELEELPTWLKNLPDDPSLLLRNKMRAEYLKRSQSQPVKQQSNGEIW